MKRHCMAESHDAATTRKITNREYMKRCCEAKSIYVVASRK